MPKSILPRLHLFFCLLFTILIWGIASNDLRAQDNTQETQEFTLEKFKPTGLERLPVMHEGRVKPIDSFARYHFKKFSGREADANQWLVETLFNPAFAENLPVLKITNPDVLSLLELERPEHKRYSYKTIKDALQKHQDIIRSILEAPQDQWSPAQLALVELHSNASQYGDILSSLTLFLPLSVQLPADVPPALRPLADRPISYADVSPLNSFLNIYIENTIEEKGAEFEQYSEAEQAATFLSYSMSNLANTGKRGELFAIIPANPSWQTAWQSIDAPTNLALDDAPKASDFVYLWQGLAESYHRADQSKWDNTIIRLHELYLEHASYMSSHDHRHDMDVRSVAESDVGTEQQATIYRPNAVKAEFLYNRIGPYYLSNLCYAFALFLLMIVAAFPRAQLLVPFALISVLSGTLLHMGGLLTRIYILQRPPVSTLYESILFVGLIAVLYGLFIYQAKREVVWLWITAFLGVVIHVLGFSHVNDGDSFLMLPAVLNTNFWLATHVITITMGYAFCLLTSMYAHYQLYAYGQSNTANIFASNEDDTQKASNMRGMGHLVIISLLFAAVGTILGGIWADQSWGRFWGWDPKENGALLIVLWLVWIAHGRLAGLFSNITYLAGMAYLSVIVALSWFGVNLLGVGLHAYGFTDTAVIALSTIVVFETVLITVLYIRAYKTGSTKNDTSKARI